MLFARKNIEFLEGDFGKKNQYLFSDHEENPYIKSYTMMFSNFNLRTIESKYEYIFGKNESVFLIK